MEQVRLVSHNSHKRLATCLQGQLGTDAEKRQVRKGRISPVSELEPVRGGVNVFNAPATFNLHIL